MDNNVNIFDNERLNDIYQKVVNGEITSTAGLNLTLDELFTMDKNGDFLLIDLLENNVDIDLKNGKIRNNGSVFFYFLIYLGDGNTCLCHADKLSAENAHISGLGIAAHFNINVLCQG